MLLAAFAGFSGAHPYLEYATGDRLTFPEVHSFVSLAAGIMVVIIHWMSIYAGHIFSLSGTVCWFYGTYKSVAAIRNIIQ